MSRQSVMMFLGIVAIGLRLDAAKIDFTKLGSFVAPVLTVGGVTITGSGDLAVLDQNGLGIAQTNGGVAVFEGQYLDFSFVSGAASGVSYFVGGCGSNTPYTDTVCGQATVQTFGVGGGSLGTTTVNGIGLHDISSLFADQVLSRFIVTTDVLVDVPNNSYMITTLRQDPITIPEPSSGALVGITILPFIVLTVQPIGTKRRLQSGEPKMYRSVACAHEHPPTTSY